MVKSEIFQDFRGLNRTSDRLNAPPDFLYDLLNGYVKKDVKSNRGVIEQRAGSEKFNSVQFGAGYGSIKKARIVFEAKWDGGSTDIIIRAGTAWGKFDGVNTFATIDTGRADDAAGQCVMFKNELIMVDGAVARKMTAAYAVANLSADANMPDKSDCVWVHRDKLWLNDTDTPMIAYFSKTNNANGATAWTGSTDAGTIDLSTVLPEGDRIRGYRTYGGADSGLIAIICDKYTVIYQAGANVYEFAFMQYFPTTCLSINACAYIGKDIAYPSRNEMTSIFSSFQNNALEVKPISHYINNLWRDLVDSVGSANTRISGVFNHKLNHYYITFPITGNYQTLVYSADVANFVGRWIFPFEIYSWCERLSGVILAGGDGYVYTMNTGYADDSTAISFRASWPAFYFKDASRYKKPLDFEALFFAENADPTLALDYWFGGIGTQGIDTINKVITLSEGSTLYYWDVALWDVSYWADVSASFLYRTSDMLGRGRSMTLEISHSTLNARVTISFFKIGYALEGAV